MKPPKKSGGRPLLWILLLILIGGGAYVAMEPEMILDLLGPLLGESPMPSQQPPVAVKPGPSAPAPVTPGAQQGSPMPSPVPPAVPTPQAAQPGPAPAPGMTGPTASVPTPPAPMSPPAPAAATPPVATSPNPMFSEGQRVAVAMNPASPGEAVPLMQDAAGTRPGPALPPGTTLTILDGELQSGGWVYSVRSDFGTKGWIAEKQLRLKP